MRVAAILSKLRLALFSPLEQLVPQVQEPQAAFEHRLGQRSNHPFRDQSVQFHQTGQYSELKHEKHEVSQPRGQAAEAGSQQTVRASILKRGGQ